MFVAKLANVGLTVATNCNLPHKRISLVAEVRSGSKTRNVPEGQREVIETVKLGRRRDSLGELISKQRNFHFRIIFDVFA